MVKNIAILGSTGSIGTQALEVVRNNPNLFAVNALTAGNNAALLIEQALEFEPELVCIKNEAKYAEVATALSSKKIKIVVGDQGLVEAACLNKNDLVLTALVGYCGLKPTAEAIKAKKNIALANKETLVVAGELIMALAKQNQVSILPVDSEHSAIFQCLVGEENNPIEKIILTASGGPFRGKDKSFLEKITKKEALKHPNWTMGAKITIDSSTLMNKGLEVIEAKWLFDLPTEKVDTIVHPQSIIHSIVQFEDGSMKAQMGLPDMKLPIQYALAYPQRIENNFERFNFLDYPNLSFEAADKETFRCLKLAYQALQKGGNMPCILNAANEFAVAAFLNDQIKYLEIPELIEQAMHEISFNAEMSIEALIECSKTTIDYLKTSVKV